MSMTEVTNFSKTGLLHTASKKTHEDPQGWILFPIFWCIILLHPHQAIDKQRMKQNINHIYFKLFLANYFLCKIFSFNFEIISSMVSFSSAILLSLFESSTSFDVSFVFSLWPAKTLYPFLGCSQKNSHKDKHWGKWSWWILYNLNDQMSMTEDINSSKTGLLHSQNSLPISGLFSEKIEWKYIWRK